MTDFMKNYIASLSGDFSSEQLSVIQNKLVVILNAYTITPKSTELVPIDNEDYKKTNMFFVTKKVEGCSDKTIAYYKTVLSNFFRDIRLPLGKIKKDDILYYLAVRSTRDKISKVTQDNELRVLRSFFTYLVADEYIDSLPTIAIKSIKQDKVIKKPFTEEEIERLRQCVESKRDKAIVEFLLSTGCRVSELCNVNITDIERDEVLLFGKGNKERYAYLNAKCRLALESYLAERHDDSDALFVSSKKPFSRLTNGAVESIIRQVGQKANIKNTHPHRFRRTTATLAINRGMPIEQVQQLLGHNDIKTTTIYARSDKDNVKASHRKYIV